MNLTVGLLGARGAGKTTLMAAMHNSLSVGGGPIRLVADDATNKRLAESWRAVVEANEKEFTEPDAIVGTEGFVEHHFRLMTQNHSRASATVTFVDHRGGDLTDGETKLTDRLADAVSILCVFDTPRFMEFDIERARVSACVANMTSVLKTVSAGRPQPPQVIFVLTKCERYAEDGVLKTDVRRRFDDVGGPLVNACRRAGCEAVLVAVETTGNVRFSRLEEDENGKSRFIYSAKPGGVRPKHADVPLALASKHLLKTAFNQKGFFQIVRDFFNGLDHAEREAVEAFGDGAAHSDAVLERY